MPGNFLSFQDAGSVSEIECSLWEQNCPAGKKCTIWANDGGNSLNATKCISVHPQADASGDSCWSERGWAGVDSCEFGSFCWDVDPDMGMGLCVSFCSGSEAAPICADPAEQCSVGKSFSICLPSCDPLEEDCPVGCDRYGYNQAFICAPDAPARWAAMRTWGSASSRRESAMTRANLCTTTRNGIGARFGSLVVAATTWGGCVQRQGEPLATAGASTGSEDAQPSVRPGSDGTPEPADGGRGRRPRMHGRDGSLLEFLHRWRRLPVPGRTVVRRGFENGAAPPGLEEVGVCLVPL